MNLSLLLLFFFSASFPFGVFLSFWLRKWFFSLLNRQQERVRARDISRTAEWRRKKGNMLKWITVNMSCFMIEPLLHIPAPINTLMHVVYYLTLMRCNLAIDFARTRVHAGMKIHIWYFFIPSNYHICIDNRNYFNSIWNKILYGKKTMIMRSMPVPICLIFIYKLQSNNNQRRPDSLEQETKNMGIVSVQKLHQNDH